MLREKDIIVFNDNFEHVVHTDQQPVVLSLQFGVITQLIYSPASMYLFKVNNGNTKTMCGICSPVKTPERPLTVNSEQALHIALVFPLVFA